MDKNQLETTKVPPLKIQGIKTKLVPFIKQNINGNYQGIYFEPFMGSGVVGFNIAPKKAIFSDTNPYIIQFYNDIKNDVINSKIVREFLETEAIKLENTPADKNSYYYEVRDRFNKHHSSLDFLFLQRSNFNGLMRFNSKGEYNVPFGRKPNRFKKALITKIVNQVAGVEKLVKENDGHFVVMPFEEAFRIMQPNDFVYLDPPYVNRYVGYFDTGGIEKATELATLTQSTNVSFALSMGAENKYRKNDYLEQGHKGTSFYQEHFYHLGASEDNRNAMKEVLIVYSNNAKDTVIAD